MKEFLKTTLHVCTSSLVVYEKVGTYSYKLIMRESIKTTLRKTMLGKAYASKGPALYK